MSQGRAEEETERVSRLLGPWGLGRHRDQVAWSSLPTRAELRSLSYAYLGQPFCDVAASASITLTSLDYAHLGQPFCGGRNQ